VIPTEKDSVFVQKYAAKTVMSAVVLYSVAARRRTRRLDGALRTVVDGPR
jgi:hypothetical protein